MTNLCINIFLFERIGFIVVKNFEGGLCPAGRPSGDLLLHHHQMMTEQIGWVKDWMDFELISHFLIQKY